MQETPDSPRRQCYGCGDANPEGLGIQFRVEGRRVTGEFAARQAHQGFPGVAHGGIAAAAIDVTEVEPLPSDDPLLSAPNLIVTPHIASASVATRTKMADMAVDAVLAVLRGDTTAHCLNPEALLQRKG